MLFANLALPSFIGHWVIFVILLPLVAVVEAIVLALVLKITPRDSLYVAVRANWQSTIAGLPLGWCMALAGLIPAGILASFLPAAYRDPSFQIIAFTAFTGGLIPTKFSGIAMAAGNLLILIPYYFVTVRIERKVVEAHHPEIDPKLVGFAVRWMNGLTYAILALLVVWWLMTAILAYHNQIEQGTRVNRPSAASGCLIERQHSFLYDQNECLLT